jgi:EAL domain-containing protein (putative c-di-GMP-specific phosphodiesterase class I)/GGDEF domain-containing protein/PAS domain-containing protein
MNLPEQYRPLPVRRVSIPTVLRLAQVLADARAQASRAERTSTAVEHRLEVLTGASQDALLILDRNGHAVSTNLTADLWALSGSRTPGAGHWDAFAWVHPQARERVVATFLEAVSRPGVPVTVEEVPVLLCTDGSLRSPRGPRAGGLVTATFTNLLGDPAIGGVVATARDVSDQVLTEEQLAFAAHHDPETGLGNRAELDLHLRMLQEEGGPVALLVLEAHGLQQPTDLRAAGGPLLPLAERLRDHVVTSAVHHLGGGRFVIASTEHLDRPCIEAAAASILQLPLAPFGPQGATRLGDVASLGAATASLAQVGRAALLRAAEAAALDATAQGPGVVVISGDGRTSGADQGRLGRSAPAEVTAERACATGLVDPLRRALDRGELEVHYQPIVDVASGRWVAVEALARWRTEDGVVPPDVFVPLAEEHGLIGAIDAFVARTAVREVAGLTVLGGPELSLHLNVAPSTLTTGGTVEHVVRTAARYGLPTARIVLEMTETSPVVDMERTREVLVEARLAGLGVALDDFSAGHMSLHQLARLPVTLIKLDRSLVTGASTSRRWQRLLRVVADAGRELGAVVLAEGVETPEDLAVVRASGCGLAQGFHLERPLTAAGLRAAAARPAALGAGTARSAHGTTPPD